MSIDRQPLPPRALLFGMAESGGPKPTPVLTISTVGTFGGITSSASVSATGITANVGDLLILAVTSLNTGAAGVSPIAATVTDASGNTWVRQWALNQTAGVAGDGNSQSLWTCQVTNPLSSASVSVGFSPNSTAFGALLYRVQCSGPITISSVGAGTVGSGVNPQTTGAVSVTSGFTIFGFASQRETTYISFASDSTNGNWSSPVTAYAGNTGTGATSADMGSEWKTVSATGNQTFTATKTISPPYCINYLIAHP